MRNLVAALLFCTCLLQGQQFESAFSSWKLVAGETPRPAPVAVRNAIPQIHVVLTMLPRSAAKRMLNSRVASVLSVWLVSMENASPESVTLTEAAVLRRVPQLAPYTRLVVEVLVTEAERNNGWIRAGRISEDGIKAAAFLMAGDVVHIKEKAVMAGLTGFMALAPYLIQRFRGQARPVQEGFRRLSWEQPVQMLPGETATAYVFTRLWPDDTPRVELAFETVGLPTTRVVR